MEQVIAKFLLCAGPIADISSYHGCSKPTLSEINVKLRLIKDTSLKFELILNIFL